MGELTVDVLVVDDDPIVRELVSRRLQETGYAVCEASDGLEALNLIQTTICRVVLTDCGMPRMSGLQLFEQVRTRWPHTLVVFMSAGPADVAETVLARGAHAWLKKPFPDRTLLRTVDAAIQRAGIGDQDPDRRCRPSYGLF